MPISKAQKEARARYESKMKRVEILLKPEEYESIKLCSSKYGMTITRYLVSCHTEKQEREARQE